MVGVGCFAVKGVLHGTDHRQTYKRWEGPRPRSVHTREGVLPVLRRRAVRERLRRVSGLATSVV